MQNNIKYIQRIVPRISEYIYDHLGMILMQDGALGHRAAETIEDLHQLGVTILQQPLHSPDLNPIEALWKIINEGLDPAPIWPY